jgi:hypothetical protein
MVVRHGGIHGARTATTGITLPCKRRILRILNCMEVHNRQAAPPLIHYLKREQEEEGNGEEFGIGRIHHH